MKTSMKAINKLAQELMLRDGRGGKFETQSFDYYFSKAKSILQKQK